MLKVRRSLELSGCLGTPLIKLAGLKLQFTYGGPDNNKMVSECQGLIIVDLGATGTGLTHRCCLPCHEAPCSVTTKTGWTTAPKPDHFVCSHFIGAADIFDTSTQYMRSTREKRMGKYKT